MNHIFCFLFIFLFFVTPSFAAEVSSMKPIIIFKDGTLTPDKNSPYMHPLINEAKGDDIFFSVQEGDLLRVASYDRSFITRDLWHYKNTTGQNLRGLPAGFRKGGQVGELTVGEHTFTPVALPSKPAGTEEWPNLFRWRHVWNNYWFITMYRYDSVIVEDICKVVDGYDLLPVLGESIEKPGERPFSASWMGGRIAITPAVLKGEELQIYYLDILNEDQLPPDFPDGLVKWIP